MKRNQFDCIAYDWDLQKYWLHTMHAGENDGEMKLAEVSDYFPPRENEHLVVYLFKQSTLWKQKLRNHQS